MEMDHEQELEAQFASSPIAKSDDDTEYADPTELAAEQLEKASDLLKQCRTLFEFLGDADFCKSITKKERTIIAKLLDKIYIATDEIDAAVQDLADEDEDD